MKNLFTRLLLICLYWLLFFDLSRVFFMIFHFKMFSLEEIPFFDIPPLFFHAFRLDLSTACYLLVPSFLLAVVQAWFPWSWPDRVQKLYVSVMTVVYALIAIGETGVYSEWKSKLDYKALHYLRHPSEIAESTSGGNFFLLLFLFLLLSIIGITAFHRFFYPKWKLKRPSRLFALVFTLVTPFLLFLSIRGGLQPIPINQSQSYYSRHNLLNLIAVNPAYNLMYSYQESTSYLSKNPFLFYDDDLAQRTVRKLHQVEKDTTVSILKNQRPNIVMLIMESWSADLIESLGGEPGITPQFRELEKEGILFTNLYSSGNRSQQGMASIFGGFPSLPITAISNHYSKFVKLPSLVKELKKDGYYTSYYFGGQLIYGGLRAYILFNDFDKIMEDKDFNPTFPRGRLGLHDEYTMDRLIKDLPSQKEPFFTCLFTLSTHSPYDQPMKQVLDWGGNEKQYINSAYYTDQCLGRFFEKARKERWYKNTLFIIVADHSHNSYRNYWVNTPEYRKIPLLLAGPVIKEEFRGKKMANISSQTDIAGTLLPQLGIRSDSFPWSKNLFNPYSPEFAYFEIQIGCGWIRKDGQFVYQKTTGQFEVMTYPARVQQQRIQEGKSYLQVLFQQFMDY